MDSDSNTEQTFNVVFCNVLSKYEHSFRKIFRLIYLFSHQAQFCGTDDYQITYFSQNVINHLLEASEPKWVNPVFNTIGVNTLRLEGVQ